MEYSPVWKILICDLMQYLWKKYVIKSDSKFTVGLALASNFSCPVWKKKAYYVSCLAVGPPVDWDYDNR